MTLGVSYTKEEIIKVVEEKEYEYLNHYIGASRKNRIIIRDNNGYKYDVSLSNFIKGWNIRFVNKSNPFSLENISLWLKLNKSQFKLMEGNFYTGTHSKLNMYCNICKDYPSMRWSHLYSGIGCGICRGFQVGKYHNLAVERPDIAKEWHPTKNGNLTPKDVTYGSNKKVWWLCLNGHEYCSSVNNRSSGTGCKICYDSQKESKIANELKYYILNKYDAKEEYLIFKNPETNHYLPFDIYIFGGSNPEINGIYIEVHGSQHFKISGWNLLSARKNRTSPEEELNYQKHKDRIKRKFARKHGVYIEIDLRKIKTIQEAIKYLENTMSGEGA